MTSPLDPIEPISPSAQNQDTHGLPEYPGLTRIARTDSVGIVASNKQHRALERRTDTLLDRLASLIAAHNTNADAGTAAFLQRLGGTMLGILNMGGFKIQGGAAGVAATDFTIKSQLDSAVSTIYSDLGYPTLAGNVASPVNAYTTAGSYTLSLSPGTYMLFAIGSGGGGAGTSSNPGGDGNPSTISTGGILIANALGGLGSPGTAGGVARTLSTFSPPLFLSSSSSGFSLAARILGNKVVHGGNGADRWVTAEQMGGGGGGGHLLPIAGSTGPSPSAGMHGGPAGSNGTVSLTPYSCTSGTTATRAGQGSAGGGGGGGSALNDVSYAINGGGEGGGYGAGGGGAGSNDPGSYGSAGAGGGGSGGDMSITLLQLLVTTSFNISVGAGGLAGTTGSGTNYSTAGRAGAVAVFPVT